MTPQIRDLCEMLTVAFIGLCMTRKNYSEVAHPFSITKRYFFADQMGKSGFFAFGCNLRTRGEPRRGANQST